MNAMQIQISTDYALRILLYLQENRGELQTATTISEAIGVTYPFFIKLACQLKKHGLVNAMCGRNGGYALGKPACEISVYDVFLAIEGEVQISRCFKKEDDKCTSSHKERCKVRRFLHILQEGVIIAPMSRMRLSDLTHIGEGKESSDKDLQKLRSRFNAIA